MNPVAKQRVLLKKQEIFLKKPTDLVIIITNLGDTIKETCKYGTRNRHGSKVSFGEDSLAVQKFAARAKLQPMMQDQNYLRYST